jgi:uncharacterized protein with ParB-like and HNH nuclease domain
MQDQEELLYDGEEEVIENDDFSIDEYDLTSTPNDFNVLTLNSFVDSGAIKIPGFQRNYVWDIKRASKLIESIILGLPIPQIFLYEENRNEFLVIDGQQRLLTIYFFLKGRFPKKEKRADIRRLFNNTATFPEAILFSDEFFTTFKLSLPTKADSPSSPFNGLVYKSLDNYQRQFDLRPIRCVVVKQNVPKNDNSSVFEIFNRLNSGGINLTPQEIRSSLYHSRFLDTIFQLNSNATWRKFLRAPDPDLHMKDIELLLRGFAMAINGDVYKPSLANFLNSFSGEVKKLQEQDISYYSEFFKNLMKAIEHFPDDAFINKRTSRFNVFLYEGLIYSQGKIHFTNRTQPTKIEADLVKQLAEDETFQNSSIRDTTAKDAVKKRLERATTIINK